MCVEHCNSRHNSTSDLRLTSLPSITSNVGPGNLALIVITLRTLPSAVMTSSCDTYRPISEPLTFVSGNPSALLTATSRLPRLRTLYVVRVGAYLYVIVRSHRTSKLKTHRVSWHTSAETRTSRRRRSRRRRRCGAGMILEHRQNIKGY